MIHLNKESTGFNSVVRKILNKRGNLFLPRDVCNTRGKGGDEKVPPITSTKGGGGEVLVSLCRSTTNGKRETDSVDTFRVRCL